MRFFIALLLLLTPAISSAETGNDLEAQCAAYERVAANKILGGDIPWAEHLMGYVDGASDTFQYLDPKVCLPEGATSGQLRALVCQTVHNQPENRHLPALAFVGATLRAYFPCSGKEQ